MIGDINLRVAQGRRVPKHFGIVTLSAKSF